MAYLSSLLTSIILSIYIRQVSLHAFLGRLGYLFKTIIIIFRNIDIFGFNCIGNFDLRWRVNRLFRDVRVRTFFRKIIAFRVICGSVVWLISHSCSGIGRFGLSKHFC